MPEPRLLDYAPTPTESARPPWALFAAIPPLVFAPVVMMCPHGYLGLRALPITAAAAALAWYAVGRRRGRGGPVRRWRLLTIIVTALATLLMAKNAADVLWLGHNPLLSRIF